MTHPAAIAKALIQQKGVVRSRELVDAGVARAQLSRLVAKGDLIVLSYGDKMGQSGGTNTISIVRVGEPQVAAKR